MLVVTQTGFIEIHNKLQRPQAHSLLKGPLFGPYVQGGECLLVHSLIKVLPRGRSIGPRCRRVVGEGKFDLVHEVLMGPIFRGSDPLILEQTWKPHHLPPILFKKPVHLGPEILVYSLLPPETACNLGQFRF